MVWSAVVSYIDIKQSTDPFSKHYGTLSHEPKACMEFKYNVPKTPNAGSRDSTKKGNYHKAVVSAILFADLDI